MPSEEWEYLREQEIRTHADALWRLAVATDRCGEARSVLREVLCDSRAVLEDSVLATISESGVALGDLGGRAREIAALGRRNWSLLLKGVRLMATPQEWSDFYRVVQTAV